MAAVVTNYGPLTSITDASLANVMAELKGKSGTIIVAFFHDGTGYVAIVKNV